MKQNGSDNKLISGRLETAGVIPTAQRIAIYRYLLCEANHPTAEEIKTWADKNFPKLSLATVYNTLNVLIEANLLKEVKVPHEAKILYDSNISYHHHFLDEDSGELVDIPSELVEVTSTLAKEFQVHDIQVLMRGKRQKTRTQH
ncbi:MAG: transcriptional repressor [Nitrospirales bacterium]|nr:transcriptional repressor [Nitrospirales bacterium]